MLKTFIRQYSQFRSKGIGIISAEFKTGQPRNGVQYGPNAIREQNALYDNLRNLNMNVTDIITISDSWDKNFSLPSKQSFNINNGSANKQLADAVRLAINGGFIPLVLGGDHSLGIGSIYGSQTSNLGQGGVIWIDAHADINTPLTSTTGNLHGQPLSFVVKELSEYIIKPAGFEWVSPVLPLRNLVYIGLRAVDGPETHMLNRFNIKTFSNSDVQSKGIANVVREALDYLTINKIPLPIHVSVDIDCLDPSFAPSTGTPVLGGLTLRELMEIGNIINDSGRLSVLDLVEVNPLLGLNEVERNNTVFSAVRTILSFFGYNTRGTVDPNYQLPRP